MLSRQIEEQVIRTNTTKVRALERIVDKTEAMKATVTELREETNTHSAYAGQTQMVETKTTLNCQRPYCFTSLTHNDV